MLDPRNNNVRLIYRLIGSFELLSLATLGSGLDWQLDLLVDANGSLDILRLSVIESPFTGGPAPTPLPPTLWLFVFGLPGIAYGARRKYGESKS